MYYYIFFAHFFADGKSEQNSPGKIYYVLYLTIKNYHALKNKCVLTRVKIHMYFYNVFLQRHFTYVKIHMVCIFTTFFYIRYVFLQRFFTYGMYFYNVFCPRDNIEVIPQIFTYVFLHMYFYNVLFNLVFLHVYFYNVLFYKYTSQNDKYTSQNEDLHM